MTVCKVVEDDPGVKLRVAGDWIAPWQVRHDAGRPDAGAGQAPVG